MRKRGITRCRLIPRLRIRVRIDTRISLNGIAVKRYISLTVENVSLSAVAWPSAGGSAQTTERMLGFVFAADFPECMLAKIICLLDPPYYPA